VDAKQARPAIRAAVFTRLAPCPCRLAAMFGEIAIIEERIVSNTARRLNALVCQAVLNVPSRGYEVPLRLILRSGTSRAGPKASFNAQRRETGRRQLWKGSSTTWDIESRRNRDVG
jgi:hypothetical protein